MKKVLKKKTWIAAAVLLVVVLSALYVPFRSSYEQTLCALVYKCDENGMILDATPVEEITIEVDVNRHRFLLSDRQTLGGNIEFSAYFKTGQTGAAERTENVEFVLESRYAKALADNQNQANVPVEGADQERALETRSESEEYLTCSNIYYKDNEAYATGIAYREPAHIPVLREMKYTENFDEMIWTDYHNQYIYICSADKANMAELVENYL